MLENKDNYSAVVVIGMTPDGGVDLRSSEPSTMVCHVALNRALYNLNVMEMQEVINTRQREKILQEASQQGTAPANGK